MQKKDIMKKIADQVIEAMDNHGKNWLCPWSKQGMPKNIRGTYYTGINTFILWCIQSENKYKTFIAKLFSAIVEYYYYAVLFIGFVVYLIYNVFPRI